MTAPLADPPHPAASPPVPVNDTIRRLQIGIAGVLTVLLLVGMADLIGDRVREKAAEETLPKSPGQEGSAPLEELGVQPVSKDAKDQNQAVSIKEPQPAAPPSTTVPDLEPDPTLERARQSTR